jgi:NAD(P)-dependent dehydrogenase (short-subunit alcohol dehydrogenase family)
VSHNVFQLEGVPAVLLAGRVAVVTGGATGIGRAIAVKFAEQGSDVIIADINLSDAEVTAREVRRAGRSGLAIRCDVSKAQEVRHVVAKAMEHYGKIDILVNNAGKGPGAVSPDRLGVAHISEEEWDGLVAINLKGAFLFSREVVPHMKQRRYGKIINISSIGWILPPMPSAHYNAAKAGIVGLTLDMASELASWNINVNAILPGPTRTEFYTEMVKGYTEDEREGFFERLGRVTPLGRMGRPEDVAYAAVFLASDWADYITGACIPVSGGLPLQPYPAAMAGASLAETSS